MRRKDFKNFLFCVNDFIEERDYLVWGEDMDTMMQDFVRGAYGKDWKPVRVLEAQEYSFKASRFDEQGDLFAVDGCFYNMVACGLLGFGFVRRVRSAR